METKNRRNLIINTTQIVVWVGIFLIPALVTGTMTRSFSGAWKVFFAGARLLLPFFILYCLNYYYLVPQYLYGGKARWFYWINAILIVGWTFVHYFPWHHFVNNAKRAEVNDRVKHGV